MLMALSPGTDAPISMSIPHLSLQDARHLQLAAQGLLTPRRAKAKPADLLATIRRMALLQIDTISVVARSPYLVLFSRLGSTILAGSNNCWPRGTSSSIGPMRPVSFPARITACCVIACWILPPWAGSFRPTG